jgi:alkanesulfonate monooxygenase SsuD/methylene tetrahydromethanopterin reductase-like flavin-dependent oxidoreductase (luciferase family)
VTRAPRFALMLLVDDIGACGDLAALAERAGAALDAAANGRLGDRAEVTAYLAERFAIAGTPDDCVAQVERGWQAGADRLLLAAITPDPRRFIERWSTEVMPRCLAVSPSIPTGGR